MGETQHAYATRDIEPGGQDRVLGFEPFGTKGPGEVESTLLGSSELEGQSGGHPGTDVVSNKEKEPHSQREAVIRPQKAGKIDFKSLNHRPRFPGASPWGDTKGSPPSPPGRSRARDKSSRRAGRSERGHQQLYRLTLSNARPNPTIGIAYPQQKITPPKKVEADRGPVLGSYRFHVPSLPERDLKLSEEELSFGRCFSEAPTSHISSNYTSQATTACPGHGSKIQPLVSAPPESPGPKGQLPYLEFQANGSNLWPPPDKGYPGANHGLPAPKPSTHCLGPLSFQYPFSPLPSSASDPFQGEAHPQDYADNISLATSQASHGAFAFHSSSRDWKEEVLGNGSYDNVESRTYGLTPPPAPFHLPQTPGLLPCYKGRSGPSADHNGAISPPGAIDPIPSTFQENPAVFPPSLHASSTPKAVGKRHPSLSKDGVASQRILDVGSSLRRNGLPVTLPQMHFQNKASNEAPSLVPFEKSLPSSVQPQPRLLQAWEGGKKTYSPMEPSSAGGPSPGGSQISFGYHLGLGKKAWQHLHLTSGVPGQNRLELSRKLASQKLPFPPSASEWEGSKKLPQSPTSYPAQAMGAEDLAPQSCSSASSLCFERSPEVETPKSKSFFLSVSPARPPIPSHHPPSPSLGLPPSTLAPSPKGSPLSSPSLNSSCSSPSLTSSSPAGHSFEDDAGLAASTFFHHQGHPKDGSKPFQASELLGASSVSYQVANPIKAFHQEVLYKGVSVDSHFQKSNMDASKRCPEAFESELPPPPYPYPSSRHFLASSLSSTSLDQLDVFLTCKQCDQNFSNLSSFLEHRQFCGSHGVLPGQAKDPSRGAEVKKQHHSPSESAKHAQTGLGTLLPSDPHLQLLALNKTVDFLVDVEGKGESRDDPLKLNQLNGFPGNFLPLNPSDLEIDDAKLDSLITEALNGLGYQSDNPEIDSSFIDVFADEDLVSVKTTNAGTPFKAKENSALGKKAKHVGMDDSMKMLNGWDSHPSGELAKSKTSKQPKERGTNWLSDFGEERHETFKSTELPRNKALETSIFGAAEDDTSAQRKAGKKNASGPLLATKHGSQTMSGSRQAKKLPCASPRRELKPGGTHSMAESTTLPKKDAKKRKPRSGSWSKELIQKIVQQKNKFHKHHSQNSKAVSLSLLANRLLPETKDNKFGEYEYMSESDDERVEYAKRHCRRKLGSRFSGRLRSGLSRRSQGRGGREKETEPIWRYGSRRGQEEPERLASKELQRADGPSARVRRRSSQSSTSSCQSLSVSSETSNSPQSTERGDSDTERESERRKQFLKIPRGVRPLHVPENETVTRSHRMGSNLPGKPNTVDPPQTQPVNSQAFQKDNPSIPQDPALNQEEGLLQSRERSHPSGARAGKGPAVLLSPEDSDQHHAAFCGDSEKPRAMPKGTGGAEAHHCHRYTASRGGILKSPVEEEEPPGSPSISKHSISSEETPSYEQGDLEGLKNQQGLIVPIGCFRDNPWSRETSGKVADTFLDAASAFYDCKELPHGYETPSLFSGPPAMGPSPNGNAYLCQGGFEVPSCKEKHDGILPCGSENAQSKVSSPLNFESPSVFLEFPLAEFDASFYDSVSSSKDNYIPFECANHQLSKIIPFDQQYSSFLPEKDWTLMEDVSPILAEGSPQIPRLPVERPTAKRRSSEISPLSLSDQLSEYNVHFMSGLSEEELEIKRLVTELENQLQASKLPLQASDEDQASVNPLRVEAKESAREFLSLRLDQEQEGKGLFLMEAGYEDAKLLSTEPFSCENVAREKGPLPALDTKYGSPGDPWPCAGSFSPLGSAPGLILVGPFSPPGHQGKIAENLKDIEISAELDFGEVKNVSARILPESCLDEVSNSSRAPDYAEQLIQSPDSIFPESLEDGDLNPRECLPLRADVFPKLLEEEKDCGSPTELETYGHVVPQLDPAFDLPDVDALEPDENSPPGAQSKNPEKHPPGKLETTTLFHNNEDEHLGNNGETGGQTVCQTLMLNAKADSGDTPHFDVLTFSKEGEGDIGFKSAPREKAGNPLHQLQLFVARTVKNNEEELASSSFPGQHPVAPLPSCPSLPPEPEEELMDKEPKEDVTGGPRLENQRERLLKKTEKLAEFPAKLLPEKEREGHFDEWASDVSKDSAPLSPAQNTNVVQQQHFEVECLEVNGHASPAGGLSLESGNLSPLSHSEVASALSGGRTQQSPVTGLARRDQDETSAAFRGCRKSPLSPWSSEKKMPQGALSAMPQAHVGSCASWSSGDEESGAAKVHQVEEREDQLQHLQLNLSLTPIYSPESQAEDVHLLQGSDFSSANSSDSTEVPESEKQISYYPKASRAALALVLGSADQEKVLKTRNTTDSGFGGIPPEGILGHIAAAGQQAASLMCGGFPSIVEKTAAPQQSPETPPFFPSCDAISRLPPEMPGALAGDLDRHLLGPQKNVPLGYSSSLCCSKVASPAAKTSRPLNLQMSNCKSPSRLPSRKHSEELSEYCPDEDKGRSSAREEPSGPQAVSMHDILLGPLPSGMDSVELRGGVCNENGSSTSKTQGAKDSGGDPQEENRDPSQSECSQKEVDAQEVPVVLLTKMADDTSRIPPRRPSSDSQGLENRSNLEEEDSAPNEDVKKSPDRTKPSVPEDQILRNPSKPGQCKARKRKVLQIACEVCCTCFRSKTGLMRHKAVKHQKKKDSVVLPDNNSAPLGKASKAFPKKSVTSFLDEKSTNSDLSKAVGQSLPKTSRRRKKGPKAQGQEGIGKELHDPKVALLDTTHAFQMAGEMQATSSQAEKSDGSEIQSRKNTRTEKLITEVHTKRSSGYTRRKTKEKPRQTKMRPDKNEVPASYLQESEAPLVQGNATGITDDHILTIITEEPGNGSEEQIQVSLLPQQPLTNELENRGEKMPSAQRTVGPQLPQSVESHREEGEEPGPEEHLHGRWPSGSVTESEDEMNQKPSEKGLFEEISCTSQNSPLVYLMSPDTFSPPGSASETGSPKPTSEEALDAPCCVTPEPWEREEPQPQKEEPAVDPAVQPDPPSLFDDDSTFSQLFPRNEEFARRKCTRVYGKRSKKPKAVPETIAKPEGPPDPFTIRMASDLGENSSFCVTREDPCEYDTISVDDALMLNMCHGSKATSGDMNSRPTKETAQQLDPGQKEDDNDLKNSHVVLCRESPTGSPPCFKSWSNLEKATENNSAEGPAGDLSMQLPCGPSGAEGNPEPADLKEKSHGIKGKTPSAFPTIDMEMLNMKFETREVGFGPTGEDQRGAPKDGGSGGTSALKPASLLRVKPMKHKLEEGKTGKSRHDLNLKNKDKQYKCKVCFQWFLTLGELDFHKLSHNPSPPPTCYMCVQRKFSSREQLRDHLKEKHAKNKAGLWACGMCLKEISDVWMYNEHLREHATQFARKGQAQKSVLGLGFSEEDAAVTRFLNSIICRKPSKSPKQAEGGNGAPAGSEIKGPKELSGEEAVVHKDLPESPFRIRPPTASLKAPAVPSPDPVPKVEGAQKSVPIHPECKDPSRDCHHCGKQFPKPFKLQRHLVVHSLQKIFLCHKCPMFYQETKELRGHLSQEHEIAEEADIKHTTLYACELCADVMHVIKKSFICSTCNYTFSKKEQYDRHMEKHLVGSSKTFRFRGVMRPGPFAKYGKKDIKEETHARAEAPAAKKKKVSHHHNSPELALPVHLDGAQASQEGSQSLLSAGEALSTATSLARLPSAQPPMETEGLERDFSSLLAKRGTSPLHHLLPSLPLESQDDPSSPEHITALSPETWAHVESPGENPALLLNSPDALSRDLANGSPKKATAAQEKLSLAYLSEKQDKECNIPEKAIVSQRVKDNIGTWEDPYLEDPASKVPKFSPENLGSSECKWSPDMQWSSNPDLSGRAPQETVSKLRLPETSFHEFPLKDKVSSSTLNRPAKEVPSKKVIGGQANVDNTPGLHCSLDGAEEVQMCPLLKDKAFPEMDTTARPKDTSSGVGTKETETNLVRPGSGHLQGEAAQSKNHHPELNKFPERPAANRLANPHPKKTKDHNRPSHRGSSASRENIEGDGSKRRKGRSQDSVKGDHVKKVDWPTTEALAFSSRQRDTHANKQAPKLKGSVAGSQLRKLVLDQGFQKKVEIGHANGELRRKKEILGSKALYPLLTKDPSASLPSSLNRRRAVQGAKAPTSHSYRTAESQNHLLNQLFGQKLTSFKIPLRRDTSE